MVSEVSHRPGVRGYGLDPAIASSDGDSGSASVPRALNEGRALPMTESEALTERAFGPRPEQAPELWDNNLHWIEALFGALGNEDLVRHVVILHKDNLLDQPRRSAWVLFPTGTNPDEALQAAVDEGRLRPEDAKHLRRLLADYEQQRADLERLAEEERNDEDEER